MNTPMPELPPLPAVSFLGDDISYGYDREDMHTYAKAYARAAIETDEWKEAVLDALTATCMDAPQDETPRSIIQRLIARHIEIVLDPSVSDQAPAQGAKDAPYLEELILERNTAQEGLDNAMKALQKYSQIKGVRQSDIAKASYAPALWKKRLDAAITAIASQKANHD